MSTERQRLPQDVKQPIMICQACRGPITNSSVPSNHSNSVVRSLQARLCDHCVRTAEQIARGLQPGGSQTVIGSAALQGPSEETEESRIARLEIRIQQLEEIYNNQARWLQAISTLPPRQNGEQRAEAIRSWIERTKSQRGP
ncbi:hypothetical protein BT69DRAFT_1298564 [Atractiella rhizophila]|nr:hypothetical protein BT69DRAFT_1298564 [Atractiella rhizophila]